jgi:hypothetical protein
MNIYNIFSLSLAVRVGAKLSFSSFAERSEAELREMEEFCAHIKAGTNLAAIKNQRKMS